MLNKYLYLAHATGEESHFLALYKCAEKYHYIPSHQIVLRNYEIIRRFGVNFLKKKNPLFAISNLYNDIFAKIRFHFLRDQIIIVGIAPYDKVMNKYRNIFIKNQCFYFTSHIGWDEDHCLPSTANNKYAFEKILKESFLGVYCVSQECCDDVIKFGLPTSVVNHSIDYDLYRKDYFPNSEVTKYVFVGTYNDRKNVPMILKWIKENKDRKVEFSFIGNGPYDKQITELQMTGYNVKNIGFCSKVQLQQILCKFDYLILPSKREPFGIVILEALASGTPCIVSNAKGPAEIITNDYNGYIFDLESGYEGFSECMNRSINATIKEKKRMHYNALVSGKKYAPDEIIKKWISLL